MSNSKMRRGESEDFFASEKEEIQLPSLPAQVSSVIMEGESGSKKGAPVVPIDSFFKRKEQQLQKKESNFSKILQGQQFQGENNSSKSMSKFSRFSKSSVRRREEKEGQLKGVVEEHKKMVSRLQGKIRSEEELNEFEKNLLREERNRYLAKIEELEAEIEQLYRDNYRLKELEKEKEKQRPPSESFQLGSLNERTALDAYKPYVISTRKNDLNIINAKNYEKSKEKAPPARPSQDVLGDKLERERPITAHQFFNKKPNNFGLYQQKFPSGKQVQAEEGYILKDLLDSSLEHRQKRQEQPISPALNKSRNSHYKSFQQNSRNVSLGSINGGQHFDTFRMANSLSYLNDSAINDSRQMANMSSTTSTRNKVAFFKSSLVIVRQPQIQIAFKRSQLNQSLNKMRLIFYLNNKTNAKKPVNFAYDYQHEYYKIEVIQKLTSVEGQAQGREVIEVELISMTDLNGVTDVHVQVASKLYDLWLPANFIRFRQAKSYRMDNSEAEMSVVPDRQFSTFGRMSEVVGVMQGGRDEGEEWGYLFGECCFGSFPVKLTWREKELLVECTEKWVDLLGFILHFFK